MYKAQKYTKLKQLKYMYSAKSCPVTDKKRSLATDAICLTAYKLKYMYVLANFKFFYHFSPK